MEIADGKQTLIFKIKVPSEAIEFAYGFAKQFFVVDFLAGFQLGHVVLA